MPSFIRTVQKIKDWMEIYLYIMYRNCPVVLKRYYRKKNSEWFIQVEVLNLLCDVVCPMQCSMTLTRDLFLNETQSICPWIQNNRIRYVSVCKKINISVYCRLLLILLKNVVVYSKLREKLFLGTFFFYYFRPKFFVSRCIMLLYCCSNE